MGMDFTGQHGLASHTLSHRADALFGSPSKTNSHICMYTDEGLSAAPAEEEEEETDAESDVEYVVDAKQRKRKRIG